jgi:hypothetical protein
MNGKEKEKEKVQNFCSFTFFFTLLDPNIPKGKCYHNYANYGLIRLNRFVSSFNPHTM